MELVYIVTAVCPNVFDSDIIYYRFRKKALFVLGQEVIIKINTMGRPGTKFQVERNEN
jgi:hypothetical protein